MCTLPKGTYFGCGKVHHPFCKRTTDKTHAIEQDLATKTDSAISKREKRRLATAIAAHLDELFCVEGCREEFYEFNTADEGSDKDDNDHGPYEAQDKNATAPWGPAEPDEDLTKETFKGGIFGRGFSGSDG